MPSTVILPIRPTADALRAYVAAGLQIIATGDILALVPDANLYAVYVSDSPGVTCEQSIDQTRPLATRRGKGLFITQDDAGQHLYRTTILSRVRQNDILGPELYRLVGQSRQAFAGSVKFLLNDLNQWRKDQSFQTWLMPVVGAYDRRPNNLPNSPRLTEDQIIEVIVDVSTLVAPYGMTGAVAFSDGDGRVGGLNDYPRAKAVWTRFLAPTVRATPLQSPGPTPEPGYFHHGRIHMRVLREDQFVDIGNGRFVVKIPRRQDGPIDGLHKPDGTLFKAGELLPSEQKDGHDTVGPNDVGVLSIQDADGSAQVRPAGTTGSFEACTKQGMYGVFTGNTNKRFLVPYVK